MTSIDDSLDVEHWNDFEDVGEAEEARFGRVSRQKVEDPVHDPRRVGLAGMDARSQNDHPPLAKWNVGRRQAVVSGRGALLKKSKSRWFILGHFGRISVGVENLISNANCKKTKLSGTLLD